MAVELDVFSGRPNPRWQLDEASARGLRDLHETLRPNVRPSAEPPALGYRGFCYVLDGLRWRAWNGSVVGDDQALADPDRSVERLLLDHLPADDDDLRARLVSEIGGP